MLTKTTQVDNISADINSVIHVRTATVIEEDGTELSRAYHRHTLAPGADLTGQDARVVAIANSLWTEDVIAAYAAKISANTQNT